MTNIQTPDQNAPNVTRRFIIIAFIGLMVVLTLYWLRDYLDPPAGDFETRQGDIHLSSQEWDEAIEDFNNALRVSPNHRGAMIGRALAFLQKGDLYNAEVGFLATIEFLQNNLVEDDKTGVGALAAAHANLGITYDRQGEFEKALEQYIESLKVDSEAVSGPGFVDRVVHGARPSTVRDRAIYILEQLKKPEDQRLLYVPELDKLQRMYKP